MAERLGVLGTCSSDGRNHAARMRNIVSIHEHKCMPIVGKKYENGLVELPWLSVGSTTEAAQHASTKIEAWDAVTVSPEDSQ